jgi:hypothetical protein
MIKFKYISYIASLFDFKDSRMKTHLLGSTQYFIPQSFKSILSISNLHLTYLVF